MAPPPPPAASSSNARRARMAGTESTLGGHKVTRPSQDDRGRRMNSVQGSDMPFRQRRLDDLSRTNPAPIGRSTYDNRSYPAGSSREAANEDRYDGRYRIRSRSPRGRSRSGPRGRSRSSTRDSFYRLVRNILVNGLARHHRDRSPRSAPRQRSQDGERGQRYTDREHDRCRSRFPNRPRSPDQGHECYGQRSQHQGPDREGGPVRGYKTERGIRDDRSERVVGSSRPGFVRPYGDGGLHESPEGFQGAGQSQGSARPNDVALRSRGLFGNGIRDVRLGGLPDRQPFGSILVGATRLGNIAMAGDESQDSSAAEGRVLKIEPLAHVRFKKEEEEE